jgi:hypothetical protein
MRWLVLGVLIASCGSVSGAPDAPGPSDARPPDAPTPDAAPTRTAIGVEGTSAFDITSPNFFKVLYTNEVYDDLGEFDPANSRFTASHAGDFEVCASLLAPANYQFELDLFVNGAREKAIGGGITAATGCRVVRLAAGGTVEIWMHSEQGANATISNDPYWNWLSIHETSALVSVDTVTGLTTPDRTFTTVPYSNEAFDVRNEYDPATSTFTASQAGDYQFCGSLSSSNSPTGPRFEMDLWINGTRERPFAYGRLSASGGCRVVRLATGDAVKVEMYQDSGAAVTVPVDVIWDWLTIAEQPALASEGDVTTFAVPGSTFTAVPYSAEISDGGGVFDVGAHQLTPTVSGDYEVCASLDDQVQQPFELDVFKDGTRDKGFIAATGAGTGCRIMRLAAGAHVDVRMDQETGATITIPSNVFWNWLTVRRM